MTVQDRNTDGTLRYEDRSGKPYAIRGFRSHGPLAVPTTVAAIATADSAAMPAGGTGAAAGAWDTAENRDTAIAAYASTVTLVNELKAQVNALLTALRAQGFIG